MKELSRLGLVEQRLSDKKSTFSAVSPRSMLSSLISIKAEELKRFRERTAQCIPVLEALRNSGDNEPETDKEARFRVTLGERKSREAMGRMWRQAREELLIMIPKDATSHFGDFDHQKILDSMSRKHVRIRIMIELEPNNLKVAKALSRKCDVRCCDQVFTHMTIVDGSQIILGGGYSRATNKTGSLASLWTDSKFFVNSMRRFFEELWKDSFSIDQKIASLENGRSPQRTEVVRSKAEISRLFLDIVSRAESRLLIAIGCDTEGVIERSLKDIQAAHKNGIRPKVLMKIDDGTQTSLVEDLLMIADVKHCQQIPFTALITDSEMILCTIMGSEIEEILWVTSKDMVDKFYSVAVDIFREGKSATTRIWEVRTGTQIGEGLFRQLYASNVAEPAADQSEIEPVLTKAEGNRIYRKMPGITYYRSFDTRTSKLQAGYAVLEPGADSGFYFHPGEEIAIVVKGSLTIDVGKESFTLGEGDTLHFASNMPHRMRNLSKDPEKVKVFTVDYPPTF